MIMIHCFGYLLFIFLFYSLRYVGFVVMNKYLYVLVEKVTGLYTISLDPILYKFHKIFATVFPSLLIYATSTRIN